jgi:DNA-binding NtrC family response regulator
MNQYILIVEDDAGQRKALAERFTREGYKVDTAANGIEGLAKIRTQVQDLVLLDLRLPDLNGLDVLKALAKDNETLPKMVILTNDESMLTISQAMDIGVTDYFVKVDTPIGDLVDLVHKRLDEDAA